MQPEFVCVYVCVCVYTAYLVRNKTDLHLMNYKMYCACHRGGAESLNRIDP